MPEISVGDYRVRANFTTWNHQVQITLESEHIVPAIHEVFSRELISTDFYEDVDMVEIKNTEADPCGY